MFHFTTRLDHLAALILSRCTCACARTAARVRRHRADHGMSTAEYALGTVAACAFAAVLFAILTSAEVRDVLTRMVTDALQSGG